MALAATATLILGATAACGSSSDSSNAGQTSGANGTKDTITITTFGDFGYDNLIKQWNADPSSPFQVKMTTVSAWDDWKKQMTSELQAGTGLTDIVAIEGDSMPSFLAPGVSDQFVDMSDPSLDNRWIAYKYAAGKTSDGKLIGLPTDAGPEGFCYREDLFKKAGLPTDQASIKADFATWDSYFATGEKYVKAMPSSKWYDSSGSIAQAMLNQTHFPFQTADNTVNVNNDELKSVWNTVTSHVADLSPKVVQWGTDWTKNFTDDGFATIPCPGWMLGGNVEKNAPGVTGWRLADAFPGGGGNWGGSFLSVPQTSQHQAEAVQFAKWLTDKDQEVAAFKAAGAFPSNIAAEQEISSEGKKDPYFGNENTAQILTDRAKHVDPTLPYKGDKYSDILGLFQTAIQRVDSGGNPTDSWNTFVQAVGQLSD